MKVYHFNQQGKRPKQEDSLFISDDLTLFVICDGVGGGSSGGLASHVITESISKHFNSLEEDPIILIKDLILTANQDLKQSCERFEVHDSSTTIALLLIRKNEAYATHIGDSKIFYISTGKAEWWVSKDHSFVQELYEAGILESEYEMKTHPMRSRITQAISNDHPINIDNIRIHHIPNISSKDIFILCTDGVMEKLSSEEMINLFSDKKSSTEETFNIIKFKCAEGSKDNNTAIVIEV